MTRNNFPCQICRAAERTWWFQIYSTRRGGDLQFACCDACEPSAVPVFEAWVEEFDTTGERARDYLDSFEWIRVS